MERTEAVVFSPSHAALATPLRTHFELAVEAVHKSVHGLEGYAVPRCSHSTLKLTLGLWMLLRHRRTVDALTMYPLRASCRAIEGALGKEGTRLLPTVAVRRASDATQVATLTNFLCLHFSFLLLQRQNGVF